MDAEKTIQDLNRRLTALLPGLYKYRVIFWCSEGREFENQINEISLDDIKLIKLSSSDCFAIKKSLLMNDTANDYLVYHPISSKHPEGDWLLNIELYNREPFRTDLDTIWVNEIGLLAPQIFRKQIEQYHKFFNSKDRCIKVVAMAGSISTLAQMYPAVMAVICGVRDISPDSITRVTLKVGPDVESNAIYREIVNCRTQTAFWVSTA